MTGQAPASPLETSSIPHITAPAHQRRTLAAYQAKRAAETGAPGAQHAKARLLSNKTPYSPTDPDARISVKPGKARALNYRCSLAVDTAKGIISHVPADLADSRDRLHLPRLLTGLQHRLRTHELPLRHLLADAGYSNGSNYALLEAQGVTAWMPVFGQYKPETEGFAYDRAAGHYPCPAGKPLPFQKYDTHADGGWHQIYWAAYRDCQQCPLKATCAPKARRKQRTKTIYDAAYQWAWHRQQTRRGQRLRRVRQSTVEPVFGNLIHHYGLRRMNVRGLTGAHKTMLLTAVAFKLKKLLRFRPQQHVSAVIALPRPLPAADRRFCLRSRRARRKKRTLVKLAAQKQSSPNGVLQQPRPF